MLVVKMKSILVIVDAELLSRSRHHMVFDFVTTNPHGGAETTHATAAATRNV